MLVGLVCVGAFVSAPVASAACPDCVMTAMPGMPKAQTDMVCVLDEGVREEQPVAAPTPTPRSAHKSGFNPAASNGLTADQRAPFALVFSR